MQVAPDDKPQIEWVLERAPVVRGIITDEAGAPIQAPFVFAREGGISMNGASFSTGENGRFETPIDIEGAARVLGQVGKNGRQYKIVGNNRVLLPMKGELKMVARLAPPVIFRARAVDIDGKPLAGVEFEAMTWGETSGQTLRLRSDENGELKSENMGTGAQLQGPVAALKGYALNGTIEIVKDGQNWTAKPLVFVRRDAELSGIISRCQRPTRRQCARFRGRNRNTQRCAGCVGVEEFAGPASCEFRHCPLTIRVSPRRARRSAGRCDCSAFRWRQATKPWRAVSSSSCKLTAKIPIIRVKTG